MLRLRSAASLPFLLSPPPGGGILLPLFCASSRGAEKPSILGGTDLGGEKKPGCLLVSAERDFLQGELADEAPTDKCNARCKTSRSTLAVCTQVLKKQ